MPPPTIQPVHENGPPPQPLPPPANPQAHGDLIDFSDEPAPVRAPDPLATPKAQPALGANATLLGELQPQAPAKDPAGPIKRQDTESNEDEVFVDAES